MVKGALRADAGDRGWEQAVPARLLLSREREFFIDNLLVRNQFIVVMIRWTGLAPWEFEFPGRCQLHRDQFPDPGTELILLEPGFHSLLLQARSLRAGGARAAAEGGMGR